MANIGEIVKEFEVVPLEAPVETPAPAEQPDRELVPAGAPSGQLSSLRREMVSTGLSATRS